MDQPSTSPAGTTSHEEQMADLARVLDSTISLDRALEAVTLASLTLVDGAELAGVTLGHTGSRPTTSAATSPLAETADLLQLDLGEGPCLTAATDERLVTSADVAHDPRWPRWGPAVAEGVGSALSVQLVSVRGVHGALTLYSARRRAVTRASKVAATVLSIHAGVALRAVMLEEDLRRSLETRQLIGQAQGILMERFGMDPDAAFAVLRRQSQVQNTKVADVARNLIAGR